MGQTTVQSVEKRRRRCMVADFIPAVSRGDPGRTASYGVVGGYIARRSVE
jgi:hypothetical protein